MTKYDDDLVTNKKHDKLTLPHNLSLIFFLVL